LLTLALFPAAEAAELARLKGVWKATSLQVGKQAVQLRAGEWSITIAGDRWVLKTPEGNGEGKLRLDLAKRPPRMDLIGDRGATLFCTYRLDQGQLRLCWWPKAKDRQATLEPEKQDPPGVLMVMERPEDTAPCSTPGADASRSPAQPGAETGEGGLGLCRFRLENGMPHPAVRPAQDVDLAARASPFPQPVTPALVGPLRRVRGAAEQGLHLPQRHPGTDALDVRLRHPGLKTQRPVGDG
jgi:uncharacterized protein (TIGR03067 family)